MRIFFLCTRHNRLPIDRYLGTWGRGHVRDVLPIHYESLLAKKRLVEGLYLFSDLELLDTSLRPRVIDLFHRIRDKHFPTLNNPGRSLTRFPLLKTLSHLGLNDFQVFGATEDLSQARYPVFLRKADDHEGPQSRLLYSKRELQRAITNLKNDHERLEEWVVTEFCDTSDAQGVFRKYSTFLVGSTLIPRHVFFDTEWVQKHAAIQDEPAFLQEERDFQQTPSYDDQLTHIFQVAHIDYGRIDFGVLNGKVQTWEINTNPTLITPAHQADPVRRPVHQCFFDRLSSVFQTYIDRPASAPSFWTYSPDRLRTVLALAHLRARHHPLVQPVKTWVRTLRHRKT